MEIAITVCLILGLGAASLSCYVLRALFLLRASVDADRTSAYRTTQGFTERINLTNVRVDALAEARRATDQRIDSLDAHAAALILTQQHAAGHLATSAVHLGELLRTVTEYVELNTVVQESDYTEEPAPRKAAPGTASQTRKPHDASPKAPETKPSAPTALAPVRFNGLRQRDSGAGEHAPRSATLTSVAPPPTASSKPVPVEVKTATPEATTPFDARATMVDPATADGSGPDDEEETLFMEKEQALEASLAELDRASDAVDVAVDKLLEEEPPTPRKDGNPSGHRKPG